MLSHEQSVATHRGSRLPRNSQVSCCEQGSSLGPCSQSLLLEAKLISQAESVRNVANYQPRWTQAKFLGAGVIGETLNPKP